MQALNKQKSLMKSSIFMLSVIAFMHMRIVKMERYDPNARTLVIGSDAR